MFETTSSPEIYKKPKIYDEQLFEQFSKVGTFEAYEYLDGDKKYRNEQKSKFLTGEITNPTLDYPELDIEKINSFDHELTLLKSEICANEPNEVVRQVYRWKINEKIAEARMLKAAAIGDEKNLRRFNKYSEFIYGKPSTDVFSYTINSIGDDAIVGLDSENSEIKQAATELLKVLPIMEQSTIASLPDQKIVNFAQAQTEKELGDLIDIPTDITKFDSFQAKAAFDTAIEKIGAEGWTVVIEAENSKTAVSVSQEDMAVKIPAERTFTRKKVVSLIAHEIFTHVLRRENGERSKLKLLGLGLDRYEAGDDGVATMREQAITGKVDDFRGIDGMLAIGLAQGIDGQPRDFREVYNILEKYYYYNNMKSGKKESAESNNSYFQRHRLPD